MEQHGFDPELTHFDLIERIRPQADALIGFEYAAKPELARFAQDRAPLFSEVVASSYFVDHCTDPNVPVVHSAFKKLVFTFTNPENYGDTINGQMIIRLVDGFLQKSTQRQGGTTLELLAKYLDILASRAYFVEQTLRGDGALKDLSANDSFAVVEAWLELATQPETNEPNQ